jgi:hypothetical protein
MSVMPVDYHPLGAAEGVQSSPLTELRCQRHLHHRAHIRRRWMLWISRFVNSELIRPFGLADGSLTNAGQFFCIWSPLLGVLPDLNHYLLSVKFL